MNGRNKEGSKNRTICYVTKKAAGRQRERLGDIERIRERTAHITRRK
jgi:hypothetical protein